MSVLPKLSQIIGQVDDTAGRSGLIGHFDDEAVKARMTLPLAHITEDQDDRKLDTWPAMIVKCGAVRRDGGPQERSATLELKLYLKEERGEIAERDLRQIAQEVYWEINKARSGTLWGAKNFVWEQCTFHGVGEIQGGEQGIALATVQYTVLFVESHAGPRR